MKGHRPQSRLAFGSGGQTPGARELPEEVAVAISFNGSTQAVMMATPADLKDFARGFAHTEGLADLDEITKITPVQTDKGIDLQIWVKKAAEARLAARRRYMAGPVGCGLCGIDSLDEALRDLTPVTTDLAMSPSEVMAAVAALPQFQKLHDTTRAVHAAGLWSYGEMLTVREDVGRHNALDKLAGAWLWDNRTIPGALQSPPRYGAVVLTSRVSIDMVQKVAAFGQPMIIAVSAPTAQAVELAEKLNITLIALARPDRFEVFTHSHRIRPEVAHVA
ncbi:formate dehydrogenase accessory sulfurtransferase FdhD [Stagnihabitans tardus]|uniref:Sulfur carrier protein FdhD n=1 Tax=Stagnihabitans tardus TaxID=2699202 RepID=A0AAE5BVK7_9RHOB|nr:formate dehydrogenase accessory sulfurtransferase FdhD [Stagnihabitans tardus]NBZ89061.1 formate dehydrogenase accessory sulfurtransferase FdhD [Stagnihabitans tardus]